MRPGFKRLQVLLAAVVVLLAACAPSQEPAADLAEPGAAEPAADEAAPGEPVTAGDDGQAGDEGDEGDAGQPAGEPEQGDAEPPAEDPASLEVTAYVVAYHWGFALFDEDGTELEQLRVRKGATVEIVAVNDHASAAIAGLPEPVAGAIAAINWHERAHHDVEMGRIPDPEAEAGAGLGELLAAAHDGHDHMAPVQDHGLMVTGVGARTFLDAHAREPAHLVFTVDREGTFEFRCTEECGFGHDYQRWELLVVEA